MAQNDLKTRISALPESPGIYIYRDAENKILYIGKAKSLKSRIRSYFTTSAELGPAKAKMVTLIADIEVITTHTELEALILEANLIRKHQPPYNVLLRDDKYFLFIKITKDTPPRIFPVRKIINDNARYFGPYSSSYSVRTTLKLLRRIFPFREEKDRPRDVIFPHTLFSHLEQHTNDTQNIIRFLTGHRQEIIHTLEQGIVDASKELQYERAKIFRDQLRGIERLEGFQTVYLPNEESFDVLGIAQARTQSAGAILQIREGKVIGKQTFLLRHRTIVETSEILRQFMVQYYSLAQDVPRTIYIPSELDDKTIVEQWLKNSHIAIPQRGVKKQLIGMAVLNAKQLLREEQAETYTKQASRTALEELLKAINIKPHFAPTGATRGDSFRVETYDISNIQGTLATASMIVFVDGVPDKKEYRKFKIRLNTTLDPAIHKSNDFAMLEETLTRRLLKTEWPIPNLIIIDGGKGQLSSAMKALKKSNMDIPIISIAKREEELFLPHQKNAVLLPHTSPALHLIQRMRDEAHRFTITYHRNLRSKEQTKSILDSVPGIGSKTKKILLQTFGSVKKITEASDEELIKILGEKKTKALREWL